MPISEIIAFSNCNINDNLTQRVCPANTLNPNSGANQVLSELTVRDAGVASGGYVKPESNTITATTVPTLRVSASNSGITMTIPADSTAAQADNTHTASVAATDELCWDVVTGAEAGTNTINIKILKFDFTPDDSGITVGWGYTGGSGFAIDYASGTRYAGPTGTINFEATETNAKSRIRGSFTCRDFGFNVNTNARTTDTTIRTRKNGADGGQNVVFAGAQTGVLEDGAGSDSLAAGDDFNYSATTGTGTETLNTRWCTSTLESTARQWQYFCGNTGGAQFSAVGGTDMYVPFAGNMAQATAVEGDAQVPATFTRTVKELTAWVSASNTSTSTVLRVRDNGGNGLTNVVFTAAQTGLQTDPINSDEIAATQTAGYQIDLTNGTGNITFRQVSLIGETAGAAGRTTKNTRAWPLGTELGMNWRGAA